MGFGGPQELGNFPMATKITQRKKIGRPDKILLRHGLGGRFNRIPPLGNTVVGYYGSVRDAPTSLPFFCVISLSEDSVRLVVTRLILESLNYLVYFRI